jgi:CheY-like chemotaxis protein
MTLFYDMTDYAEAKKEAERANEAKSDFLASISHEIRTPMNAIIGIANMMEDTSLTEQQHDYLKKIQHSSGVMLDLINDILDFSKIESGKLDLIESYFDFSDLLRSLKSVFDLLMGQKNLGFNCSFSSSLPEVVYGDAKRIRQILVNILNNAYKYTMSGWVDFNVWTGEDDDILFAIKDTGIGIKEEDQPKLFSEFVQFDEIKNRDRNIGGTGLGLAITKKLVEGMSGIVSVASEYGKGSTFTVRLPLRSGVESDLDAPTMELIQFTAPGAKALIVDDIEINLEIAAYMLEAYEIESDTAANGAQALEKVQEKDYHFILMDHMMPVMDGIEATKCIRQLPGPVKDVPIIALTANAISGNEKMFKDAGFDAFISKPIEEGALTKTLLRLLPPELIREG